MFPNVAPYEIIAAPFSVYWAPVETAFPAVDDVTPGVGWSLFGTSGDLNMNDDPVVVSHPQTIITFRPAGSTASRKASRTEEDLTIAFTIVDLTMEQYRLGLNMNAMTTVPAASGVAGEKWIGMTRGPAVQTVSLLVRGPSPYGNNMALQFEVPVCYEAGSQQVSLGKGDWAGRAMEFRALVDPDAATPAQQFGTLRAMTTVALP